MKTKINYNYILIGLSIICLCVGWFVPFNNEYITVAFYIASYLLVGAKVLYRVMLNFMHKNFFDENTLMGIASIGAICLQDYREAIFVMLLYSIGTMLQSRAVNKSRRSIAELMNIQAEYAFVMVDGVAVKKEIYDVKVGDILLIKAGEKVAVDAVVVEGESSLDTSTITGESCPHFVRQGDAIISGSINKDGVIYARATAEYYDSTVSKILELVEDATSRKSKCEHFITKFAKYYTPVVCLISLLLFVVPVIFGLDAIEWLKKALIFLVVSCPCALVISVPLSFFGGIGGLSRQGILIKGSNYLEALAKAKVVAFDKTGTLTNGEFEVEKICPYGINENDFISYLYNIEKYSNHILGKVVTAYCEEKYSIPLANKAQGNVAESCAGLSGGINLSANGKEDKTTAQNAQNAGKTVAKTSANMGLNAVNVKEVAGYGIFGQINGGYVYAGSDKLLADKGIKFQNAKENGTIVYLAKDGVCLGYVVLKDKVKPNVATALEDLKTLGINKTILLSGDRADVVTQVGKSVGASESYGGLLPNQKVDKVENLKSALNASGGKVVFVGDGVNDAPVLTASDIGIAMGGFGADCAKEAGDVVIMNDEIEKVPQAIWGSKKTMRIIMENVTFALVVKFAILVLDIFGFATMWLAVFADVGVTILAILNSLRTLNMAYKKADAEEKADSPNLQQNL